MSMGRGGSQLILLGLPPGGIDISKWVHCFIIIIICRNSNFVSTNGALTCAIADCLTQCPHRFVSLTCPFCVTAEHHDSVFQDHG